MTISTNQTTQSYVGNGVTTSFATGFVFQLPSDLVVQTQTAAGIIVNLVQGVDYSVTGGGSPANTGSVITNVPVASGTKLLISRNVPLSQLTHWVPNDPNPSTATENAVDKLTMLLQQYSYQNGRSWYLGPFDIDGSGAFDGRGNRGTNIADPIYPPDVVNLGFMENYINGLVNTGFARTPIDYEFVGNGATTVYSMPGATVPSAKAYYVTLDGILQRPDLDYIVVINANPFIQFTSAPPSSVLIGIRVLGFAAPLNVNIGSGTATVGKFLRGDLAWENTLVGPLGDFGVALPTDPQTLFQVRQNAATSIKIASGANAQGSLRFAIAGTGLPWNAEIAYDPIVLGWGWRAYGGPLLGVFFDSGDIDLGQNTFVLNRANNRVGIGGVLNPAYALDVLGGCNISGFYTGNADGSLITTGQVAPARLGSNVPAPNLFLAGDGTWKTAGGGGGGPTTIQIEDAAIAATVINKLHFAGDLGSYNLGTQLGVAITSIAGTTGNIAAYLPAGTPIPYTHIDNIVGPGILGRAGNFGSQAQVLAGTANQVLRMGSVATNLGWGLLGAANITPASLTPALLNSTNAAADTLLPSYDAATGHFKWVAAAANALPANGHVYEVLRGDTTWSNRIKIPGVSINAFTTPFTFYADHLTGGLPDGTFVDVAALSAEYDGNIPFAMNLGGQTTFGPQGTYTGIGATWTAALWKLSFTDPASYPHFVYGPSKSDYHLALTGFGTFKTYAHLDAGGTATVNFSNGGFCTAKIEDTAAQTITINFDGIHDFNAVRPENRVFKLFIQDTLGGSSIATTWVLTASDGKSVTIDAGALPSTIVDGMIIEFWLYPRVANYSVTVVLSGIASTSYTDAQARAAVGSHVVNSASINMTYNGGTQNISASIANGGINSSTMFASQVLPISAINASGTADSTTYLCGDGTWKTPTGGGAGDQPRILFKDDGVTLNVGLATNQINFIGAGVTVTSPDFGGTLLVNIPGGGGAGGQTPIQFKDEGTNIGAVGAIAAVNFVGPGVSASVVGTTATITIPGGGANSVPAFSAINSNQLLNVNGTGTAINWSNTFAGDYNWSGQQKLSYSYSDKPVTQNVYLNSFTAGYIGSHAGIKIEVDDHWQNTPGEDGYSTMSSFRRLYNPGSGTNNHFHVLDIAGSCTGSSVFQINTTSITQARKLNYSGSGGTIDSVWLVATSPNSNFSGSPDSSGFTHSWTSGGVRIGEVNYGNGWADFGLQETRGSARFVAGLEFFPDYLNNFGGPTKKYNVQWAISIGLAGPGDDGVAPKNWIGMLIDVDGIVPGGYDLRLWGGSTSLLAPNAFIKGTGYVNKAIDVSGANINLDGNNKPVALSLSQGQAIQFAPNVYIYFDGTNLKAYKNGTTVNII